ncbi:MAG: hypothetical protein IT364_20455 [Candidatus Hydrogenedentes bacterium]|nr:hypothetical protein [Candidatus Hydrogenedentota bacterium]
MRHVHANEDLAARMPLVLGSHDGLMDEFLTMRRVVWICVLGITALRLCEARAQGVAYLNSAGERDRFDAAQPPDWARVDSAGADQFKFNEIAFTVTYKDRTAFGGRGNNRGFDDPTRGLERRAVVERVLAYLGDVLNETAPAACEIVFDSSQTDSKGFLATAGPLFFEDPAGFRNGFAFDHITTGLDPLEGSGDIICRVDFGYPWYTDAAPTVPEGTFDLFTALLHELTHGMGLLSLSGEDGMSLVSEGNPGVYTFWDALLATGNGQFLFNKKTKFRATTESLIGSDGGIVAWGPVMQSAYGGLAVPVYAPSPFLAASSLNHFDESLPGPLVMKPVLDAGVSIREYSQLDIAALRDIGYTKASSPGNPTAAFLSSEFSIEETDGQAVIVVQLSEAPGVGKSSSLRYEALAGTAEAPGDFADVSGTLTFVAFDESKSFTVPIEDDGFREPPETILLKLRKPEGLILPKSNRSAALTILDNDSVPGAGFTRNAISLDEGSGSVKVTVELSDSPRPAELIRIRVIGIPGSATAADFSPVDSVIEFAPGVTQSTVDVTILEDSAYEESETFGLQLVDPVDVILKPSASAVLITILDDDPDSDHDGLSDADEASAAFGYATDPGNSDSDGDSLTDGEEVLGLRGPQTNPLLWDSDGDGASDGVEVYAGSDPTDPGDAESLGAIALPRFSIQP